MFMRTRVLGLLLAALLISCGEASTTVGLGQEPSTTPSPATLTPLPEGRACPKQETKHLPADVTTADAAYVCTFEFRKVPGDGEWEFDVVKQVTDGLDELLATYAAEDAPLTSGFCTLELPAPLLLWLHRGADVVAVRAPYDSCHKPSKTARAAYDALVLTTVTSVKKRQTTSQRSIDSHCSDAYKDMLAVEEEFDGPKQTSAEPRPFAAGTRICRYDVELDKEGDRIGHLVSSESLTAGQIAAANAALSRVRVDAGCSRHGHTRFGLLLAGAENSASTLVALDGCAVQQDSGWWRADDELRRLLS